MLSVLILNATSLSVTNVRRLLFHVEISSLMLDAALRECLTAATGITAGFFTIVSPLIFLSLTCHSGVLIHCKWSATSTDTAAAVHLVSDLAVSLIPAWPFESCEASFDFNLMGAAKLGKPSNEAY